MFTPTLPEAREMAQQVRAWLKTKHEPYIAEREDIITKHYSGTSLRVVEIQACAVEQTELVNFCDDIQPAIYHRVFRSINSLTLTVWFFYDPRLTKEPEAVPEDYEEEDY